MGLKRGVVVVLEREGGFRRTLVGLKQDLAPGHHQERGSFRRTLVGLKPDEKQRKPREFERFRRTLVGLKHRRKQCTRNALEVSDVPLWG